jgi:hypothetical protein
MTSAPDGGERSASRPSRLTPRERAPDTHCIGGWVGPRASLDAMENSQPLPGLEPPVIQPLAQRYKDTEFSDSLHFPHFEQLLIP